MDKETRLQMQISDVILEVANSYPTATTSDLQAMADVAAKKIGELVRTPRVDKVKPREFYRDE
jgi:hypothetical protein